MCLSPIHITNKTKTCKDGLTRKSLVVPCGHCDDCRSSQADAWFQRIYQEQQDCEAAGGRVVFVTFTYNNIHLPRFYYVDDAGNHQSFPCFNKQHKDRYVMNLRKYFEQHYHLPRKLPGYQFKYIWCSEYGLSEKHTHRPHYHVLFFLPKPWLDAHGYDELAWKRLLAHYWSDEPYSYGFTRFSPGNSIFVNSEFAGIYASKYICKDINFYRQPEVENYMDGVKVSLSDYKYVRVSKYLPHHWQSEYFGASLEEIYSVKDNYIYGYDYHLSSEDKRGKSHKRSCPQYIVKRMLYTKDALGRDVLNDRGRDFKKSKFLAKLRDQVVRQFNYTSAVYIRNLIDNHDMMSSNILSQFDSISSITDFISSILVGHKRHSIYEGLLEFVLWNRVWSGLWTCDYGDLVYVDSLSHEDFVNVSCEQYINNLYTTDYDRYHADGVFHNFDPVLDAHAVYYDTLERFRDFRNLQKIIGEIDCLYKSRCHRRYLEEREIRKNLKFNIA